MTRISQELREQVRQRANGRCEYCHKPDEHSYPNHQVDHIISVKHKGSDEFDNLAWACFICNSCKGSDVAAWDKMTGQLASFFNPRTQVWEEHFGWNGNVIVGKTAIGRVTIELLQMNHEDQLGIRRELMDAGLW